MNVNEMKTEQDNKAQETCCGSASCCESLNCCQPYHCITEAETGWNVLVCLPGFTKDAVAVSVAKNILTVKTRDSRAVPETWRPVYRSQAEPGYCLQLSLGETVDTESIEAKMEDGVLELQLSKVKSAQKRSIEIA